MADLLGYEATLSGTLFKKEQAEGLERTAERKRSSQPSLILELAFWMVAGGPSGGRLKNSSIGVAF